VGSRHRCGKQEGAEGKACLVYRIDGLVADACGCDWKIREEKLKPKTGFESGSSPTIEVSDSGAVIQTGRGLQDVRERIRRAFEQIHGGHPAPERREKQPQVYTPVHAERFHQKAKALTLRALSSSHISKSSRNGAFEIAVPTESAEELIREALGE